MWKILHFRQANKPSACAPGPIITYIFVLSQDRRCLLGWQLRLQIQFVTMQLCLHTRLQLQLHARVSQMQLSQLPHGSS